MYASFPPRRLLFVSISSFHLCFRFRIRSIHVKVLDPSSAAVPGARVAVFSSDGKTLGVGTSAGDGVASFKNLSGNVRALRVDALRFRSTGDHCRRTGSGQVQLSIAVSAQTVVVTADATPLESAKAGAAVSSLDADTLSVLNLPEVSDNLRFLSGVYVSDTGQRGGLTTHVRTGW